VVRNLLMGRPRVAHDALSSCLAEREASVRVGAAAGRSSPSSPHRPPLRLYEAHPAATDTGALWSPVVGGEVTRRAEHLGVPGFGGVGWPECWGPMVSRRFWGSVGGEHARAAVPAGTASDCIPGRFDLCQAVLACRGRRRAEARRRFTWPARVCRQRSTPALSAVTEPEPGSSGEPLRADIWTRGNGHRDHRYGQPLPGDVVDRRGGRAWPRSTTRSRSPGRTWPAGMRPMRHLSDILPMT